MAKPKIKVSERKDWGDDKALLALQTAPKEMLSPTPPHGRRRTEHLDPLGDVRRDESA